MFKKMYIRKEKRRSKSCIGTTHFKRGMVRYELR